MINVGMSYTLIQKIKALLPPNTESGKDKIIFASEGNQGIIVNNLHRSLDENDFSEDTHIWKNVWNLRVHEWIKNFI